MSPDSEPNVDVAIAGAGFVGLTLALALKKADPHLSVAVIDPRPVAADRKSVV